MRQVEQRVKRLRAAIDVRIEQGQAAGAAGDGGERQPLQLGRRDESQVRHLVVVRAEDAQVLDPVGAAVAPRDDVMGFDENIEAAEEALLAQALARVVARGVEVVRAGPVLPILAPLRREAVDEQAGLRAVPGGGGPVLGNVERFPAAPADDGGPAGAVGLRVLPDRARVGAVGAGARTEVVRGDAALALFLLEFAGAAFALDALAQTGPVLLRIRAAVGFEAGRRAELRLLGAVTRAVLTAAIAANGALALGAAVRVETGDGAVAPASAGDEFSAMVARS